MHSLKVLQTKPAPVQSCPRADTCGMVDYSLPYEGELDQMDHEAEMEDTDI